MIEVYFHLEGGVKDSPQKGGVNPPGGGGRGQHAVVQNF